MLNWILVQIYGSNTCCRDHTWHWRPSCLTNSKTVNPDISSLRSLTDVKPNVKSTFEESELPSFVGSGPSNIMIDSWFACINAGIVYETNMPVKAAIWSGTALGTLLLPTLPLPPLESAHWNVCIVSPITLKLFIMCNMSAAYFTHVFDLLLRSWLEEQFGLGTALCTLLPQYCFIYLLTLLLAPLLPPLILPSPGGTSIWTNNLWNHK